MKNQSLSTTGGVTICTMEKDGITLVGIAICATTDTFNKKFGRDRSQGLVMSRNKFKKINSLDKDVIIPLIKDMAKSAWFRVIHRGDRISEFGANHKIILSSKKSKDKKKVVSLVH